MSSRAAFFLCPSILGTLNRVAAPALGRVDIQAQTALSDRKGDVRSPVGHLCVAFLTRCYGIARTGDVPSPKRLDLP